MLCYSAGYIAVNFRITEQPRPQPLVAHLRGFTLGVELLITHMATPARDLEGDDDSVPHPQIAGLRADLAHNAHRLVTEDVSRFPECAKNFVQVPVRTADVRRCDFDDGIGGLLDLWVGHRFHPYVALAVPGDSLHGND